VTLAELQALLHGRITGMVPGREDELRTEVVARPPLEALERVEIYAGMYPHRLVDAIAEDVPHTSRVLGHDAFLELVRAYLHEHPSRSPDIGQAGRSFGAWLRSYRGIREDLPDLALLERARSEVRAAADEPVAGAEELQSLNPDALPGARFHFSPALRLLRLQHDVRRLWDALEGDAGDAPDPEPAPTTFVVWRQEFKVFHTVLSEPEARALMVARDGGTLEEICATFAGEADPAQTAFKTVLSWFADGWVAADTSQRA
jgi:hypothetical protein